MLLPVEIASEKLVLFRDQQGAPVALRDRCAHRFAPLSKGRLEADGLRCMYHGLKFASNGACIEIPGQDMPAAPPCVRAFPVVARHDWLWIWMGEPALADEALIPEGMPLAHPDWASRGGYLDYAANYMLINDNLLDFSHLSFVHAGSFGAGEGWAQTQPSITPLPRGVRVSRWVEDQPRSNSRPDIAVTRVDHWSTYDYLVPGVLLSYAHTYPVGVAKQYPEGQPPAEVAPVYSVVTAQAVTPIDEGRTRYFFSRGVARHEADDARLNKIMDVTKQAFEEDRQMIEAQQKVLRLAGGEKMFVTAADRALIMFRRTHERLLKAEGQAPASSVRPASG